VFIGLRSMILPGVIGDRCIIEAGSIVTNDIPPNSVAVGVPAKVVRSVDSYIEKLHEIKDGKVPRYFFDLDQMHSLNPNNKS
jgi:acetyltransferase-like isoleucine patch superfamily enzyme